MYRKVIRVNSCEPENAWLYTLRHNKTPCLYVSNLLVQPLYAT